MPKRVLSPKPVLCPIPVVLIACLDETDKPNVLAAAWVGMVSSSPPQIALGLRPYRYSRDIIARTGEFTVNLPNRDILLAVDQCGMTSGRREDKFALTGLTAEPATEIAAPVIEECPVNLECIVRHELDVASHHLLVAEIVAMQVDEDVLGEGDLIDYGRLSPIGYLGNEYWSMGEKLETSGVSLRRRSGAGDRGE